LATYANYGNISAYFSVTSKHFEAALTYLSMGLFYNQSLWI